MSPQRTPKLKKHVTTSVTQMKKAVASSSTKKQKRSLPASKKDEPEQSRTVAPNKHVYFADSSSSSEEEEFFSDEYDDPLGYPRVYFVPSKPMVTDIGVVYFSRSFMPRKMYDFENVPKSTKPEPSLCANLGNTNSARCVDFIPYLESPGFKSFEQKFVLLTDCRETFAGLLVNNFARNNNCVVVWTPLDSDTFYFLRLLRKAMPPHMPFFALIDYDPMSLKLMSFFENWKGDGTRSDLADVKLDIKWLGLKDIHINGPLEAGKIYFSGVLDRFDLIERHEFVQMDDQDVAVAKDLLEDPFVKDYPRRLAEVNKMIDGRLMLEMSGMASDYLQLEYLPTWIRENKWI